jgi:hypothetical protein
MRKHKTAKKLDFSPKVEAVSVKCAACGKQGEAFKLSALAGAVWYQLPAEWWSLSECLSLHVRCPKCLLVRGKPC